MQSFRSICRASYFAKTNNNRLFSLGAHGTKNGELVNGVMSPNSDEYKHYWSRSSSSDMYEISLNHRHTCDIELLLNGAFSPLNGFMTEQVYNKVVNDSRLPNGLLWPMPINLDISEKQALEIESKKIREILLRDGEGNPIAIMDVEDIFKPNKKHEADVVFGGDLEHPAIHFLNNYTNNIYIGGKLHGFQLPPHYDYEDIRKTPQQVRQLFKAKGWNKVVAFQTRNPMHRAHFELTKRALELNADMNLLVHPVVGMTKPGDIDHHTRVKCYREIMPKYPKGRAELVVFPLAMRMGGPREAIWHALIRKNYGATHFILGRDHAGPGSNSKNVDFYTPYAARDAAVAAEKELGGLKTMAFEMMVYSPEDNCFYADNEVPKGKKVLKLSGTEVRKRLRTGEDIPEWFSFKEVVKILRQAYPPRHQQGFVVFFTGLSGSGKSTVANALREKLMEMQERRVAMLDGDYVRKLISSELGFSTEHRNLNIQRIGFISSLISNAGGIVISAPIAPYEESRNFSKQVCSEVGGFVQVWISTPVSTCEKRDRKGLYAKAKQGLIKLTGVNDPYENPSKPDIAIDTTDVSIEDACNQIVSYLSKEGWIQDKKEKLIE